MLQEGDPHLERTVSQWEIYDLPDTVSGIDLLQSLSDYMERHDMPHLQATTQIMIMPGYRFRIVHGIITNFHQPQSTLLLLVSAFVGEAWRDIYRYALAHDFRFLSYGDSSILLGD